MGDFSRSLLFIVCCLFALGLITGFMMREMPVNNEVDFNPCEQGWSVTAYGPEDAVPNERPTATREVRYWVICEVSR